MSPRAREATPSRRLCPLSPFPDVVRPAGVMVQDGLVTAASIGLRVYGCVLVAQYLTHVQNSDSIPISLSLRLSAQRPEGLGTRCKFCEVRGEQNYLSPDDHW